MWARQEGVDVTLKEMVSFFIHHTAFALETVCGNQSLDVFVGGSGCGWKQSTGTSHPAALAVFVYNLVGFPVACTCNV